ncbi:MAG: glycosyltransferase, partial [Thermomicrobiales bacterium]
MFVITCGDSIGGAQIHVRDLARRLSADGVAVHISTGAAGPLTETLAADGIPVTIVPGLLREIHPVRDAQAIAALRGAMCGFAPDLVSTHSSKAGIAGRIAGRWAAPLSARIVCVSAHDRRLGVACGIRGDRLVTIRNGMPDIPESLRARPGRDTGGAGLRLVMTARFDRQKDHRTMLLALREVEGAQIAFVGDGPDQRAVADLAETLGVA